MATINELLLYGKEKLEQTGNEYAKYERKVLLEEALGLSYMQMLLNGDCEVQEEEERQYKSYIERRMEHYPLQYILGYAHFMDYTFFVNENVLIPRNDTEILVEQANAIISNRELSVLDLCCGSGCIGISLKLYNKNISLTLSDLSEKALEVTKKNLEKYDVLANVQQGDLFESIEGTYDVIVSNPPYIERRVIDTLMPEVKDFEPMMALDGGESGLDFYERIVESAPRYLNSKGYLIFEIGYNQGEALRHMMEAAGFTDVAVIKDYAGLDRVVIGHRMN